MFACIVKRGPIDQRGLANPPWLLTAPPRYVSILLARPFCERHRTLLRHTLAFVSTRPSKGAETTPIHSFSPRERGRKSKSVCVCVLDRSIRGRGFFFFVEKICFDVNVIDMGFFFVSRRAMYFNFLFYCYFFNL